MRKRVQGWLLASFLFGLAILGLYNAGVVDSPRIQSDELPPPPALEVPSKAPVIQSGTTPDVQPVLTAAARSPSKVASAKKHPVEPLDLYLRNIERAKAGNARSQYRVAQALQKCRMAVKSEERLDEIRRTIQMTEEEFEGIEERYQLCKGFSALVSDINGETTKWLHLAAENGDPLAKSYEAIISYPNFDADELRMLVREALRTGESEAYHHAVMFYANVNQPDSVALNEAWFLISCESDDNCDVEQARDRIKQQYRTHERLQIGSYESQLRDNLNAKAWDQLGF